MSLKEKDIYRFDEFELDRSSRTFSRLGAPIPLYPKAFEILIYLVANPGRVVTKEELFKAVWPEAFVEEGNLARQVSSLRKALGDRASCIVTVPGRGYQFGARVEGTISDDGSLHDQTKEILVQRVRERTQVVIEESFPAPVALPSHAPIPFSRRISRRMLAWFAFGMVLVAAAAIYGWIRFSRPPELRKAMVADFTNTTGDATFDRTLKRALEIDLEQSPYMDVMSDGEALSTLRLMGRNDDVPITPEIARELCERSNRQVLLAGNIAQLGGEYLLTLEATDCASGKRVTGAKAEAASREKVLAALDSLVNRVRSGLGESGRSLSSYQVPIQEATTTSIEALKSFSMGIDMQLHGKDETETLPFFQRAVELDPKFAMAYGAIGSDYYNLNEMNLAAQYYKKAVDLSGPVSAKEKLILKAHYYAEARNDLPHGIETYRQWAQIYPNEWTPWADMANEYTELGQYTPAIADGERALQIEPNLAVNYGVLVRAYRRANRFAEAKSTGLQAIQRHLDSANLHGSLYQIAIAEHDAGAHTREAKWAADHSQGWYGVFFADVQAEEYAFMGKYRESERAFRNAWDTAERQKMPESADDILLDEAFVEFSFGQTAAAHATLARVRKLDPDAPDAPELQAQLGNTSLAEAFVAAHGAETDPGTLMNFVYLPRVRAALAMQRGKPLEAIDALETASPYELADYNVPFERATACLLAKRPDLAVPEFKKILSNPGIDSVSILYPLAHLGLARAFALQVNKAGSKSEYKAFLAIWKDADPDIPVLQQARREYAQLR
jgi:DNA-binding winged helix-turn-helix (wHTH) protein/tetratricopeptide (TPR) repeat protein